MEVFFFVRTQGWDADDVYLSALTEQLHLERFMNSFLDGLLSIKRYLQNINKMPIYLQIVCFDSTICCSHIVHLLHRS